MARAKVNVALRALNRTVKVRVKNTNGVLTHLRTDRDTAVDVNDPYNRRSLAHHGAIGQWITTGVAGTAVDLDGDGNADDAVPANGTV
jgi:hypothetical protein